MKRGMLLWRAVPWINYLLRTLEQMIVGVPLTRNNGPRTDTVSPIFIPARFAAFSNMVSEEVFTTMVEKPADPIMPGRLCSVKVSPFITESTLAVIQAFIKRMWFVLSCGGVPLTRVVVGSICTTWPTIISEELAK